MINAIDTGLRRIKDNVAERILEVVFRKHVSIDAGIRAEVIDKTVIPDCNLNAGKVLSFLLKNEYAVPCNGNVYGLYRIPPEAREGRNIIEVHYLTYRLDYSNILQPDVGPDMMQYDTRQGLATMLEHNPSMIYAAQNMLQSKTGINNRKLEPIPELLHGNMIRLHPEPLMYSPWTLTCRVCYDNEMTNLNSAAIVKFANLCEYALKRYCYNKLIFEMDSAAIEYGSELPVLKDMVSSWADMRTLYEEECARFSVNTKLDIRRFESLARNAL